MEEKGLPAQAGEDKSLKSSVAENEEAILDFWEKNEIFKKSLEKPSPSGEFVFYDGPVTSNAKPVFHTMEPFAFKDIIPRYKTMKGFHVRRKGGWDTHGLPVELQIEKKLGFKSKKDIEDYGIAEFNKLCKESVWEYIELWKAFTKRMAYWADQDNAYVTYENNYIESIWNILKTVDEKKLLYKDYKVLPWCPRCGTALSSHELAQGYQDDKDLSITAKFKVIGPENTYILAWTTTPWTLPGNVALAVGEDIDYVKIKIVDDFLILAKERLSILEGEQEIVEEMKGSKLIGIKYEPLFPYFAEKFKDKALEAFEKSYQVYSADFVNTTEGTGVVHTAVMYGQDDFVLGTKLGLPKFHLVKENGHFLDGMDFLSDRFVKDEEVAVDIIKNLAGRGLLFKKEKYEHSYPHCWRCKTPLIYYARDSWYIKMSSLRDDLLKENEKINWEPEHIKEGRFGEWLREIKDWAISRERYWGTPLPIWTDSDGNYRLIGSVDEIRKLSKKSKNKYFVMRHGETENNVKKIWNVDSHVLDPLTPKGEVDVKNNAKTLKEKSIDLIFTSPFERTMETAELVAKELGLDRESIITDPRLGEWNVGEEFNNKSVEDFFAIRNKSVDRYAFKTSDGESFAEVLQRSGEFIYDLDKKYNGKNILVITHGAVTRSIVIVSSGFSFEKLLEKSAELSNFSNAEIREVDFVPLPHNEKYELDLHKPYIDDVALFNEKGAELKRVKEVMDVWFDSGAMPFAQDHYPFDTASDKLLYPADFISEAIDQTRGWFYTLHAIGVLMGKGQSYRNVICLGHILDSQGRKMSKSVGNILDPWDQIDKHGVDAIRLWMYTVNSPGDSKNFDEKTVDEILKKVFNPISNIVSFYELYKNDSILAHDKSTNILDKWILSRLNKILSDGTKSLEKFQVFESARLIKDFANDFSTWYIRRSRDRFKSEDIKEKTEALSTTAFVLLELSKYMAPFTPFFAESVFQKIKTKENKSESVHLENWPVANVFDEDLLNIMEEVRNTVTQALELRQKAGQKVRQPLSKLTIPTKFSEEFLSIICDEINVKEVVISGDKIVLDTNVTKELQLEGIARDIIRGIQDARKTENLNPSDKVHLIVHAHDDLKKIFDDYAKMIQAPTGVSEISYIDLEQKYKVSVLGGELSISLKKQ